MAQDQPEHREIGDRQRHDPQRHRQHDRAEARQLEQADAGDAGAPAAKGIDQAGDHRHDGEDAHLSAVGAGAKGRFSLSGQTDQGHVAGQQLGRVVALAGIRDQHAAGIVEGQDTRAFGPEIHRVGRTQQLLRQGQGGQAQEFAVAIQGLQHDHDGFPADRPLGHGGHRGHRVLREIADHVAVRQVQLRVVRPGGTAFDAPVHRHEGRMAIGAAALHEIAQQIRTHAGLARAFQDRWAQGVGGPQCALQQSPLSGGGRCGPAQQRDFGAAFRLARQVQVLDKGDQADRKDRDGQQRPEPKPETPREFHPLGDPPQHTARLSENCSCSAP